MGGARKPIKAREVSVPLVGNVSLPLIGNKYYREANTLRSLKLPLPADATVDETWGKAIPLPNGAEALVVSGPSTWDDFKAYVGSNLPDMPWENEQVMDILTSRKFGRTAAAAALAAMGVPAMTIATLVLGIPLAIDAGDTLDTAGAGLKDGLDTVGAGLKDGLDKIGDGIRTTLNNVIASMGGGGGGGGIRGAGAAVEAGLTEGLGKIGYAIMFVGGVWVVYKLTR